MSQAGQLTVMALAFAVAAVAVFTLLWSNR